MIDIPIASGYVIRELRDDRNTDQWMEYWAKSYMEQCFGKELMAVISKCCDDLRGDPAAVAEWQALRQKTKTKDVH